MRHEVSRVASHLCAPNGAHYYLMGLVRGVAAILLRGVVVDDLAVPS